MIKILFYRRRDKRSKYHLQNGFVYLGKGSLRKKGIHVKIAKEGSSLSSASMNKRLYHIASSSAASLAGGIQKDGDISYSRFWRKNLRSR